MLRFVCDGFCFVSGFCCHFVWLVGGGHGRGVDCVYVCVGFWLGLFFNCLVVVCLVLFFFPVLFESATVTSCLPDCFCNLQTSKLFSNGDKEP